MHQLLETTVAVKNVVVCIDSLLNLGYEIYDHSNLVSVIMLAVPFSSLQYIGATSFDSTRIAT